MSSHKEAPGIVNDAAADNTDVYAFVSPDKPDTVTLIANFVPLEDPDGGPNFFEFGNDVLYEILVDNNGDGNADITYQFSFEVETRNEDTFLYNTGPIESLDSKNWNRRQFATVKQIGGADAGTLGSHLACPPCNIGPVSTPDYKKNLADPAIHDLGKGRTLFTGQRAEGFYVDLGAIFDLGILRPFLQAHLANMPAAPGVNSTLAKNIHTIAIQVPITDLVVAGANHKDTSDTKNTIGVYARASRQRSKIFNTNGTETNTGPYVQISRLGNPLVNEVLISINEKDKFNASPPANDSQFLDHFTKPELAGLLPVLYPGVFPNLAKYKKDRADIVAIFLTGIPAGVISADFQNVGDGKTQAELLRLNTAVPPTTNKPSNLGLLGMDLAGFPNGRRVFDDVTTIELRALAGATIPLVDKSYKPDAAAGAITPGLTSSSTDLDAKNTEHYLDVFPYLGTPHSGYRNPADNDPAPDLGAINQGPDCTGSSKVPVGAPNTGIAPESGSNTGLYVGGALAAAGAVAAAGVAAKTRLAPATAPATRPSPGPRASTDTMDRSDTSVEDAGE